ncbi:MAG: hypothetical protein AAFQ82_08335 [Myxococcota bacterium]
MELKRTGRLLTDDELHQRVAVRPPYLALRNVRISDEGMSAEMTAEQDRGRERSPVSAGEAGRHLAILSSCALALSAETSKEVITASSYSHYLAQEATLRWLPPGDPASFGSEGPDFVLSARSEWTGRRAGQGTATLATRGAVSLYALDVRFTVLPARVFERMFRAHAQPTSAKASPYGAVPPLSGVRINEGELEGTVEAVAPSMCAGHFDGYPALPVAILMGFLSNAVGRLHASMCPESADYLISHGEISAEHLVFAGSRLTLRAHRLAREERDWTYGCEALDPEGRRCGKMKIRLRALRSS